MKHLTASPAVQHFDTYAHSVLVDVNDACVVARRSRASIYRHFKAGDLTMIKVGSSTRVRVGELRRLIGVVA